MQMPLPQLRPPVCCLKRAPSSTNTCAFAMSSANVYAFDFVLEHITPLVQRLRPCFTRVQNELKGFAAWWEQLAQADND